MALESATYISDLVATNPTSSDPKAEGDNHVRLVKGAILATFPNVTGAMTATHTQLNTVPNLAPIASPTFTGVPAAPTATTGTSTTQLATTAFVAATALAGVLPGQTGNAGKFITTDGTNASWSGLTKTIEVLTSGTSWVCPAGVTAVKATLVGGGGGGGRSGSANSAIGGAAGGTSVKIFVSTPTTSYSYAIGALGAAAASDSLAGSAGGNTTFNTGIVTVTANGGGGGGTGTNGVSTGGAATNGDLNIRGDFGYSNASHATASMGGSSTLGCGGAVSASIAAQGYGAGGYGNLSGSAASAGTQGVIILEY
jgi:hypothetical protein